MAIQTASTRAIVEDLAEVLHRLGGLARALLDDRRRLGQAIAVDVADVGDLDVAPGGEEPEVVAPHPARADQADGDARLGRALRRHTTEARAAAARAPRSRMVLREIGFMVEILGVAGGPDRCEP